MNKQKKKRRAKGKLGGAFGGSGARRGSPRAGKRETKFEGDAYFKLYEAERAFLHPEIYGIDLRPDIRETINPPGNADNLSDQEVAEYIRDIVYLLAEYHLYLKDTNHLGDREFYRELIDKIIPMPLEAGTDLKGALITHECCSCDDLENQARFYATDFEREEWAEHYFDELHPMPEREPLASSRDVWLEALVEAFRDQPLPNWHRAEVVPAKENGNDD